MPDVAELRAVKLRHPELGDAVDLHIELVELQRRVQHRVPLPRLEVTSKRVTEIDGTARPLLRFEDVPMELSDLRLMVRQTSDILRRHGAIEDADDRQIQSISRNADLPNLARAWYVRTSQQHAHQPPGREGNAAATGAGMLDDVFALAMWPFLSRCADAVQPLDAIAAWRHGHCPLCGGQPYLAVITNVGDRLLICERCHLRWAFDPVACPFCGNHDRRRVTSFATQDGRYRVYGCDVCKRYLKAYDGRRTRRPVMPHVDGVATLPLDAAAVQRGYHG
ncbi:MAG: formate dehydrogenase accessory protein FdhE [Acidimicrobiia bacterium]|nr:formate dehydrogenase accessory protein FdhE [Acidimicrobiia bacterium]